MISNFLVEFIWYIQKCIIIHHLNIIKITKKDYKKGFWKYQSFSEEEKEKKR